MREGWARAPPHLERERRVGKGGTVQPYTQHAAQGPHRPSALAAHARVGAGRLLQAPRPPTFPPSHSLILSSSTLSPFSQIERIRTLAQCAASLSHAHDEVRRKRGGMERGREKRRRPPSFPVVGAKARRGGRGDALQRGCPPMRALPSSSGLDRSSSRRALTTSSTWECQRAGQGAAGLGAACDGAAPGALSQLGLSRPGRENARAALSATSALPGWRGPGARARPPVGSSPMSHIVAAEGQAGDGSRRSRLLRLISPSSLNLLSSHLSIFFPVPLHRKPAPS